MVEVSSLLALFKPGLLIHWLPGMLLGLAMLVAVNRYKTPLALPIAFAVGLGVFTL